MTLHGNVYTPSVALTTPPSPVEASLGMPVAGLVAETEDLSLYVVAESHMGPFFAALDGERILMRERGRHCNKDLRRPWCVHVVGLWWKLVGQRDFAALETVREHRVQFQRQGLLGLPNRPAHPLHRGVG